ACIMPVTNAKKIRKITSMCGFSIPEKFQKILNKYENNTQALKEAGTAYATEQIIDLITSDIDGIHLYTMNKVDTAKKIMANIAHIREISGGNR
ncbi:MAG: methylenetetrahydrofolate reductase, partial [Fusobacterium sp.]|nr:methylenetetrahydrofolate reductase [Fusobacterium sp.]